MFSVDLASLVYKRKRSELHKQKAAQIERKSWCEPAGRSVGFGWFAPAWWNPIIALLSCGHEARVDGATPPTAVMEADNTGPSEQ